MSEKKIVVPDFMVQAGATGFLAKGSPLEPMAAAGAVLIESLRWLAENPIVPRDKEANELSDKWFANPGRNTEAFWRYAYSEVQRRMFLAPEPEVKKYSDPEFEAWWSSTNNQNWFSNKPIDVSVLKETAFYAWRAHKLNTKPEVPEEIKDLLVDATIGSVSGRMDAVICNERVIEAYRRGQRSGK